MGPRPLSGGGGPDSRGLRPRAVRARWGEARHPLRSQAAAAGGPGRPGEGDRPWGRGASLTLAVFRLHQAVGDGVAQGHDLVVIQQAEQVTTALSLWAAEPRHLDPREGGERTTPILPLL